MKVILISDVKSLGKRGELKEVSDGYARNFLFPKKLAEIATSESIAKLKKSQEKNKKEEANLINSLKEKASLIENKKITLKVKAEKEKLFGSVGEREISKELKKQGFEVEEKSIILESHFKKTGEFKVIIDFGKNIKTKITVAIEKA